jgi:hypothetical protein
MVRRGLARVVGHEGALVRPHLAHEVHQVVERVAFDVVFGLRPLLEQVGQVVHVVFADVACVGARMHRDAVRAGFEGQRRGTRHARDAERAGVAQQGHLVQVDRQRGEATLCVEAGGQQWVHGVVELALRLCTSSITCRVRSTGEPR